MTTQNNVKVFSFAESMRKIRGSEDRQNKVTKLAEWMRVGNNARILADMIMEYGQNGCLSTFTADMKNENGELVDIISDIAITSQYISIIITRDAEHNNIEVRNTKDGKRKFKTYSALIYAKKDEQAKYDTQFASAIINVNNKAAIDVLSAAPSTMFVIAHNSPFVSKTSNGKLYRNFVFNGNELPVAVKEFHSITETEDIKPITADQQLELDSLTEVNLFKLNRNGWIARENVEGYIVLGKIIKSPANSMNSFATEYVIAEKDGKKYAYLKLCPIISSTADKKVFISHITNDIKAANAINKLIAKKNDGSIITFFCKREPGNPIKYKATSVNMSVNINGVTNYLL